MSSHTAQPRHGKVCRANPESAGGFAENHLLVAGLGNELLMDDGVGVHAVRLLQQDARFSSDPNLVIVEVGVAVLDALHLFAWADHILAIDAMKAGHAPGSMYQVRDTDVAQDDLASGLHQLSVIGALRMLPGHRAPGACGMPRMTVLGVEPERIDYGMELSPTVASVLPRLVEETRRVIQELRTNVVHT